MKNYRVEVHDENQVLSVELIEDNIVRFSRVTLGDDASSLKSFFELSLSEWGTMTSLFLKEQ